MITDKNLYAIKSPSGSILFNTVSDSKSMAWDEACIENLRGYLNNASNPREAAYKRGYRCVKIKIEETA